MSTAEFCTAVANHGVQVVFQFLNEVPCTCKFECLLELLFGRFLVVFDIVTNRAVEQKWLLRYETDFVTNRVEGVIIDASTVDQHIAAVRNIVTHEQFENRGFSGPSVTHNAKEIAAICNKGNAAQHLDGGVWISEVHISEFNRGNAFFQFDSIFCVGNGGFQVNSCKDAACCCFTTLKLVDENSKDEHGHGHSSADQQESHELSSRDFTLTGQPATGGDKQSKGNTSNHVNHRKEAVSILAGTHGLVSIRTGFTAHTVCFPTLCIVGLNH